jgi:hypothetical protein
MRNGRKKEREGERGNQEKKKNRKGGGTSVAVQGEADAQPVSGGERAHVRRQMQNHHWDGKHRRDEQGVKAGIKGLHFI